ncbi:IS30 family transposase [Pelagibaculum spongiae]|uniref:IS30 family transposase n=1 Tax=Pelagibaculum spongiae TaxID=2080658 RepID=A0A2V1GYG9_9GAMM|nr:IS30 family transposase [Pelagibaculum spongiae]
MGSVLGKLCRYYLRVNGRTLFRRNWIGWCDMLNGYKKTTENVVGALISLLLPLKKHVKTITFDNGREFASHQNLSKKIKCDNYFAKPYSSWERGQNENANGLLRRYFPKTMSLKNVKNQEVIEAVDRLNSRPRKCLNYQTAYEAFEAETKISRKQLLGYALKI